MKQTETWKFFDKNKLTHSAAHYLMTIQDLIKEHGYARTTDIAKSLKITAGSCSTGLKKLEKKELVDFDDNKHVQLTQLGEHLANMVRQNDRMLSTFFHEILDVDKEQAEIDACKMEHLLSAETSIKLARLIKLLEADKELKTTLIDKINSHSRNCKYHDDWPEK